MTDRRDYQHRYWQQYKEAKKRVYGTLSPAEYRLMERRAAKFQRSVWSQIWIEACCYRQQERLLPREAEDALRDVKLELRAIHADLQALSQNNGLLAKLLKERAYSQVLQQTEQRLEQAVKTLMPYR